MEFDIPGHLTSKNTAMNFSARKLLIPAVVTAAILALANTQPQFYESEFVKTLRDKYKRFYEAKSQELIYVQTDKTLYYPGETVWFSVYLRNEKTLKPSAISDIIHIEWITPKGTVAKHYKLVAKNGVALGDIDLKDMVGGIYKLKAYTQYQKNDTTLKPFEKEITIQSVVQPRLKMKLEFDKKAYGKGDVVMADLEIHKNDNTPLSNAKVNYKVSLAGSELYTGSASTDAQGKTRLKFTLPENLNTPDGLLNAMMEFEGRTESISRSVPIVLNQIDLQLFPEGGDMVAGVQNRIAFRAMNEFGKPADVEGVIVDDKGAVVQKFSSYHFGMGAFDLTPQTGTTYKARITKPAGILSEYPLPQALPVGYVLQVNNAGGEQLQVNVNSWREEHLHVVAQTRGQICFAKTFRAVKGDNSFAINTGDFPMGVTQITLFDSKGIARCERLAFVGKKNMLNISVTTDKDRYQPRETVKMNIRVTDENGLPVPGHFALSVVDDNLLTYADDKQGNIIAKMLLEPELKEKVEEPNFYFDKKQVKADKALDYLLMTAGWRRYTWKQIRESASHAPNYLPEKAELTGLVIDGYSGSPIIGATVKLLEGELTSTTNEYGRFSLRGFDIARFPKVEVSAQGFNTQTFTLQQYGDVTYYLYGKNRLKYLEDIEVKEDERHEKVIVRGHLQRASVAKKHNEFFAPGLMDMAVAPGDAAPFPVDEGKVKEPVAGNVGFDTILEANANVQDGRLGVFSEYKIKGPTNAIFYRAREFPKRKYTAADSTRNDFASTIYWNGNITTDRSGRANVEFVCNDLISSFRAVVEGFGDDGSIGRAEHTYSTQLPFSMEIKVPNELVAGDKMMIPVFLKNTTTGAVTGTLNVNAPPQLHISGNLNAITIEPGQSRLVYLEATATNQIGEGTLEVKFTGEKYQDAFAQKIKTVAKGFPAAISISAQELTKEFYIHPTYVVPGSMKVTLTAYPNILSDLMSGVDAILREPYGCFEQTSSSNYPNVMALRYLQTTQTSNAAVEAKARKLLDNGYKKLVSFETKENGYEWFGAAPAHEALTAYGLMQFIDMKAVYPHVDEDMIKRTVQLLLDKRDGNGGFKKNPRALDSFGGADTDITNCYIVYAMSEAGMANMIEKELEAAYREAKRSGDPYMVALMANVMFNKGDAKRGEELMNLLQSMQQESGCWVGKKHSITRSTGQALKVETTALVALAAMKSPSPNIEVITRAVKFLVSNRSGYGMFGSTQSTILALKALTRYAEFSKRTDESGTIQVYVNNTLVAEKDFAKGEKGNIVITGLEQYIREGKQKVEVHFKGCKNALPYTFHASYSTSLPQSDKECVVSLETKLSGRQVRVGETLRMTATLKNTTQQGQPMTMAILGIPAGFSAQPWQLKELQEKGIIDFYEISGNSIACYYRDLAPGEVHNIHLDLKAEIPGEYSAQASSGYLYYTNEYKHWAGLDKVYVTP
ncbi:MAG: MG2 domain-containing protein [Chitinophagales bacterium]|nr:MG2 domain-containing protein [Chitinophagales bacterium]